MRKTILSLLFFLVAGAAGAHELVRTVAGLGPCAVGQAGPTMLVTDGITVKDCTVGAGNTQPHHCTCDNGTWKRTEPDDGHTHTLIGNDLAITGDLDVTGEFSVLAAEPAFFTGDVDVDGDLDVSTGLVTAEDVTVDQDLLVTNGSIGIGVAVPLSLLHVEETAAGALTIFRVVNKGPTRIEINNTDGNAYNLNSAAAHLRVSGPAGIQAEFQSGGNFSINTGFKIIVDWIEFRPLATAPSTNDGTIYFDSTGAGAVCFRVAGAWQKLGAGACV